MRRLSLGAWWLTFRRMWWLRGRGCEGIPRKREGVSVGGALCIVLCLNSPANHGREVPACTLLQVIYLNWPTASKVPVSTTTLRASLLLRRHTQQKSPFNKSQNKGIEGLECLCINHRNPDQNLQRVVFTKFTYNHLKFSYLCHTLAASRRSIFFWVIFLSPGWLVQVDYRQNGEAAMARYGIGIIANKGWVVKWRQTSGPGPYL